MSSDIRLIERWLPIAALGEESVRERRSMTALPPTYYLHLWWARRPLVASRAAIIGSLLPAEADRTNFLQALGILGDPVATRRRIDLARRRGERFEGEAYGYPRAFTRNPDQKSSAWLKSLIPPNVQLLDPTAGGGSIPFEAARLGIAVQCNDLNPVAAVILKATVEYPFKFGRQLAEEYARMAKQFVIARNAKIAEFYPAEPEKDCITTNYLWARTVRCPYCDGIVPMSPEWRLSSDGTGVRLVAHKAKGPLSSGRHCTFDLVRTLKDQSSATVSGGDAICPYSDCGRVIDGDEIKLQARAGRTGDQLYAIVYKRKIVVGHTKGGKEKTKWVREFRTPSTSDDNLSVVSERVAQKLPDWEAGNVVPTERFPEDANDSRPTQYGVVLWRDFFSPRQLLCHVSSVEVYRELLETANKAGPTEVAKAALVYLAFAIDKLTTYNCRSSRWHPGREVMAQIFERHDFSTKWTYAEIAPITVEVGSDWAVDQIGKCVSELVWLARGEKPRKNTEQSDLISFQGASNSAGISPMSVTCQSADSLGKLADSSIDVVVIDPPYYNNVMYAELADFFYVWLKRTAGYVLPDLFRPL